MWLKLEAPQQKDVQSMPFSRAFILVPTFARRQLHFCPNVTLASPRPRTASLRPNYIDSISTLCLAKVGHLNTLQLVTRRINLQPWAKRSAVTPMSRSFFLALGAIIVRRTTLVFVWMNLLTHQIGERDFEDLKLLISHQKAKHFKCDRCGRRLNTAGGKESHLYSDSTRQYS